jgi:hypothetical protein
MLHNKKIWMVLAVVLLLFSCSKEDDKPEENSFVPVTTTKEESVKQPDASTKSVAEEIASSLTGGTSFEDFLKVLVEKIVSQVGVDFGLDPATITGALGSLSFLTDSYVSDIFSFVYDSFLGEDGDFIDGLSSDSSFLSFVDEAYTYISQTIYGLVAGLLGDGEGKLTLSILGKQIAQFDSVIETIGGSNDAGLADVLDDVKVSQKAMRNIFDMVSDLSLKKTEELVLESNFFSDNVVFTEQSLTLLDEMYEGLLLSDGVVDDVDGYFSSAQESISDADTDEVAQVVQSLLEGLQRSTVDQLTKHSGNKSMVLWISTMTHRLGLEFILLGHNNLIKNNGSDFLAELNGLFNSQEMKALIAQADDKIDETGDDFGDEVESLLSSTQKIKSHFTSAN